MYYIISSVCLLFALLLGFYLTLRADKRLDD